MEVRYRIPTAYVPSFSKPISKYKVIRGEDCINCNTCGKLCIYGVHKRDENDIRIMSEPLSSLCKNCFLCVRECPVDNLTIIIDPEYKELGDNYYPPELVLSIRSQAEDGKIPVFGAGYKGAFSGKGYDSIWTDMSEIVRPTRDGIHGREFISTTITLGRKLPNITGLKFSEDGSLISSIPPTREIPIPIVFNILPFYANPKIDTALALAANKLGTFSIIKLNQYKEELKPNINHIIFKISSIEELKNYKTLVEWASILEINVSIFSLSTLNEIKEINPNILTVVNVPLNNEVLPTVETLVREEAEIIHLSSDIYGRGNDNSLLIEVLPRVHKHLVSLGIRDEITLLVSGGIGNAEHIPKTIILGADGVIIDVPILLALECRLCKKCIDSFSCPQELDRLDPRFMAQRIINLMASWHSQLLEVLGAMGLREVRRLRGEIGRAIFKDDLEKEIMGPLFKLTNI